MSRSWCHRRIFIALVFGTFLFVLLKLSDPNNNSNSNSHSSSSSNHHEDREDYYQDTNSLNKRLEKISRRPKSQLNATKKFCYRTDDDMGETIIFIQFNNKWTDFDTCAVKTASMFNPQIPICVLHAGPETIQAIEQNLKGLTNVQAAPLDVLEILDGTPLYEWYVNIVPHSTKRRYFHTELLDALRIGYLYKYGGIYMDTDVWTLRSFETLEPNTIANEARHLRYLSNFVMSFQKRHPFINDTVQNFEKSLNASKWGSGGPLLLTKLYENRLNSEKRKNSKLINVIDADLFYPIHISHGPIQFESTSYDRVTNLTRDSYTVHLWREVYRSYWTGRSIPQKGSFVWTIYDSFCTNK